MSRGTERAARGGVAVAAALLLGGIAAGAAVRALTWTPPPPVPVVDAGDLARARSLLSRIAAAVISLQKPDGSFDRVPGEEDYDPEVKQTVSAALCVAGLGRAREMGATVEGLDEAIARGLDLLKARQAKAAGGTFGSMPPGSRADFRPSLHAVAAGVLALTVAGRPEDESALQRGASAYVRAVAYGAFEGWTRALAALTVDALVRTGRVGVLDRQVTELVSERSEGVDRIDCGDFRLAEAIARRVRAPESRDTLGAEILVACLEGEEHPRWTGESTDLQSWYLQAWLAARYPKGREWFRRFLGALEEGVQPPFVPPDAKGPLPPPRLSGGVYADVATQNACALLALAEGLEPREP